MSGHSKWATIKHKKGAADKARGKLFAKLARQIEVTARSGGGDPDMNPSLRTAVAKAKASQMTNDAIDRAIKRGTGEQGADSYESILYEAYAPGGVAVLIDVLTDNRNRTGAEIRNVFTKHGGSMAEPGAVSWQFSRKGMVVISGDLPEDDVMMLALDTGADDVTRDGDHWRVECEPSQVAAVADALSAAGQTVLSADAPLIAENAIHVDDLDTARKILRVMSAIEDNDDVQDVFANFDMSEEIMEEAAE